MKSSLSKKREWVPTLVGRKYDKHVEADSAGSGQLSNNNVLEYEASS